MSTAALLAFSDVSGVLGISGALLWVLIAAIALWTIVLKGFSLWHAARNYQRAWFIGILVINTFGILELIYLVWFRADKAAGHTLSLFNTPVNAPEGPVSSASV